MRKTKRPPQGIFYSGGYPRLAFEASGEYRPPLKSEYYLSGAIIEAWYAYDDLSTPYWIARPIELVKCSCCNGTGKVKKSCSSGSPVKSAISGLR